jgi:hypothetical protein
MSKIICITSNNTTGGTFLDWSLHYLTGQDNYYRINEAEWIPLVNNPLSYNQITNAHGHKKNHPSGYENTKIMINRIPDSQNLYSFYAYPEHMDVVCQTISVDINKINDPLVLDLVRSHRISDYKQLIQYCFSQDISVVYIHPDPKIIGYFWDRRSVNRMAFSDRLASSITEYHSETQNIFFQDSLDKWEKLNLTAVWDVRERMALDMRPYDTAECWTFGFDQPFIWINCQELWHNTEYVLLELINQLKLTVDKNRFTQWLPIAQQWQKLHHKNLKFFNNLDYVIACIVNGWHYPIESLTLQQEAIIQHNLIYRHNLNLKTWGLEKFPDNTAKLHVLLEQNIHTVDSIYIDKK